MRLSPLLISLSVLTLVACSDAAKSGDEDGPSGGTTDAGDSGDPGTTDPNGEGVDADGDGFTEDEDCDDADATVNPAAVEVCDGIDNDCNDATDDADDGLDRSTATTWYGDSDGDDYGTADVEVVACAQPMGTADNALDCDDDRDEVNPGAPEVCDDLDNDCNGAVDDDDPGLSTDSAGTWYADVDSDGYGDATSATVACVQPSNTVDDDSDCDDGDAAVNPMASEVCDGIDNDCNGDIDDDDDGIDTSTQTIYYADGDTDGYGDDTDAGTAYCTPPSGVVTDNTDCDDASGAVNPGATEVCDAADVDENCNGTADDADGTVDPASQTAYYPDADSDGYGDASDPGTLSCEVPSGLLTDNTDCDDAVTAVNPGATELCNGVDDDCDSGTSEAGMVSWEDTAGTVSDVSSTFTGTSSSPTAYTSTADGTLWFCDGTFYTSLTLAHSVDIAVASGSVALDGADTDRVVTIETDGMDVTLTDVTVQAGSADFGGGLLCNAAGTSVSLSGVTVTDCEAQSGGGIANAGCELDLLESTVSNNVSSEALGGGGGLLFEESIGTLTESFVQDNTSAGWAGGIAVWGGSSVTVDSTLVDGNDASLQGGGADVFGGSSLICTGDLSATEGFTNNVSGLAGGAISIDEGSGANTVTASTCDFGTLAGGDDSSPEDIAVYDSTGTDDFDVAYLAGDDASFSCASGTCGTSVEHILGTTSFADFTTPSSYYRGNLFEVAGTPTLDAFDMYVDVTTSCTVDAYVHVSTDGGTTWSVLWSDEVATVAGDLFAVSGPVGLPLNDGEWVAVGFGWDTASCGSVTYWGYDETIGTNIGIGTFQGLSSSNSYGGYDPTFTSWSAFTTVTYGYDMVLAVTEL